MAFTAACPFCSLILQNVPDQQAGASIECPRCRNCFTLAVTSGAPEQPAQARKLKIKRKIKSLIAAPSEFSIAVAQVPISMDSANSEGDTPAPLAAAQTMPARPVEIPVPTTASALGLPTPAVGPTKRQDPALVRMLLAFIFAGLSLALSQAPYGRITSVVLAVPGLFFGLSSLSSARKRLLPGLAAGLNAIILLVAMLLPSWLGLPSWWIKTVQDEPGTVKAVHHGTGGASSPAEWVDASKDSWRLDDVLVSVRSLKIDSVQLTGAQGKKMQTKEPYLQIWLRVTNEGFTRKIDFRGWNPPEGLDAPRVTDSAGNTLPAKTFEGGWEPPGKTTGASLFPGKWTDSLLIFAAPTPTSGDLHLELPGSALGASQPVRLQIPRAWLSHSQPKKHALVSP
jgi:hypothetical protein